MAKEKKANPTHAGRVIACTCARCGREKGMTESNKDWWYACERTHRGRVQVGSTATVWNLCPDCSPRLKVAFDYVME